MTRAALISEQVPVGIYEIDLDGCCRYVNQRFCELAGMPAEALMGDGWRAVLHPDDVASVMREWSAARAQRREFRLDYRHLRPDGTILWVAGRATEMTDGTGRVTGLLGTVADITERRKARDRLVEATDRFSVAFDRAPIGMGILDLDGRYEQVNPALAEIAGRAIEDLVGRRFAEVTHPDDVGGGIEGMAQMIAGGCDGHAVELRGLRPDGTVVWVAVHASVVRDAEGNAMQVLAQVVDITDRRRQDDVVRDLADHDDLTGLPNRRRFEEEVTRHLAAVGRHRPAGALLILDLDGFKAVNDRFGHHVGDRFLVTVADILRGRLREGDFAARLGGDEFGVLLPTGGPDGGRRVAEALTEAIARAGRGVVHSGGPTASVGVAWFDGGESADDVLIRADEAMYAVKRVDGAAALTAVVPPADGDA